MSIVLGELLTGRPSNVKKLQTGFNMEIISGHSLVLCKKAPNLGGGGTQSLELLF